MCAGGVHERSPEVLSCLCHTSPSLPKGSPLVESEFHPSQGEMKAWHRWRQLTLGQQDLSNSSRY